MKGQHRLFELRLGISCVVFQGLCPSTKRIQRCVGGLDAEVASRKIHRRRRKKTRVLGHGNVRKATQFKHVHDHVVEDGRCFRVTKKFGTFVRRSHHLRSEKKWRHMPAIPIQGLANPSLHSLDLGGTVNVVRDVGKIIHIGWAHLFYLAG